MSRSLDIWISVNVCLVYFINIHGRVLELYVSVCFYVFFYECLLFALSLFVNFLIAFMNIIPVTGFVGRLCGDLRWEWFPFAVVVKRSTQTGFEEKTEGVCCDVLMLMRLLHFILSCAYFHYVLMLTRLL